MRQELVLDSTKASVCCCVVSFFAGSKRYRLFIHLLVASALLLSLLAKYLSAAERLLAFV